MKRKRLFCTCLLCVATLFIMAIDDTAAYDDEITHPTIMDKAVKYYSNLAKYLKTTLNFTDGLLTTFPSNSKDTTILYWLTKGSIDEDHPLCRSTNHFHDPLKNWDSSYVSDVPVNLACPAWSLNSNITWATGYLSQPPLNPTADTPDAAKASFPPDDPDHVPNTWDNAREDYYNALTLPIKDLRETSFAQTFQAVGQVAHLLQDMAVPAHVRNDLLAHLQFHGYKPEDLEHLNPATIKGWINNAYESYVKTNPSLVDTANSGKIKSALNLFDKPRLTDFWDTNQYKGSILTANLGLSEFTNLNYLSDNTIPTPLYSRYPWPHISIFDYQVCRDLKPGSESPEAVIKTRKYISRRNAGYCPEITAARTADHFAAVSFWSEVVSTVVPSTDLSNLRLYLDDNVHNTYAKDLLPLAIGYSARLLDYFFRGQIDMKQDPDDPTKYFIKNKSDEKMEGSFKLFYDSAAGVNSRFDIKTWDNLTVDAKSASDPLTFTEPADPQEPGTYMLVFSGIMGNERGAVVGKVVQNALDITPPDEFVYSITDGSIVPQQFNKIKVKIMNKVFIEPLQAYPTPTLQAVARYKKRTDYQPDLSADPPTAASREPDFSSSRSAEISLSLSDVIALNSGPTKFTFDFSGEPIPAGITDLSLYVVFKGGVGSELNAEAVGIKDLSEPTHHVFRNETDMVSLQYHLYVPEQVKTDPNLADLLAYAGDFNIDPEAVTADVAYSDLSSQTVAPSVATLTLDPGRFSRLIALVDDNSSPVVQTNWAIYGGNLPTSNEFEGAVSEDKAGVWTVSSNVSNLEVFRSVRQHFRTDIVKCKPAIYYTDGTSACPYPENEAIPADLTPVPAALHFSD